MWFSFNFNSLLWRCVTWHRHCNFFFSFIFISWMLITSQHFTGFCHVPLFSWPHGLQLARLLCPWDSLSKNTGRGCHCFLQGIFLTQAFNPHLLQLLPWQWIRYYGATWEVLLHIKAKCESKGKSREKRHWLDACRNIVSLLNAIRYMRETEFPRNPESLGWFYLQGFAVAWALRTAVYWVLVTVTEVAKVQQWPDGQ